MRIFVRCLHFVIIKNEGGFYILCPFIFVSHDYFHHIMCAVDISSWLVIQEPFGLVVFDY